MAYHESFQVWKCSHESNSFQSKTCSFQIKIKAAVYPRHVSPTQNSSSGGKKSSTSSSFKESNKKTSSKIFKFVTLPSLFVNVCNQPFFATQISGDKTSQVSKDCSHPTCTRPGKLVIASPVFTWANFFSPAYVSYRCFFWRKRGNRNSRHFNTVHEKKHGIRDYINHSHHGKVHRLISMFVLET